MVIGAIFLFGVARGNVVDSNLDVVLDVVVDLWTPLGTPSARFALGRQALSGEVDIRLPIQNGEL
jgi:hypothetical protein